MLRKLCAWLFGPPVDLSKARIFVLFRLNCLGGWETGMGLREWLTENGMPMNTRQFYRFMSGLENEGAVEFYYRTNFDTGHLNTPCFRKKYKEGA